MKHCLSKFLVAVATVLVAAGASAQAWPARPIALVVPFAAGGPTDTIGRLLAERMSRSLGQTIAVENVAGAGGTIANNRVLKAPADGHTIIIGHVGTHVMAQAVQGLNVDYVSEYEPVAMVASNPQVIVSRNGLAAKSLQDIIALAKAAPGKLTYGTGGPGTPSHVMAAHFSQIVAPLNIVHYKGAAPAMQDVMAEHVDLSFDQAVTGLNFAKNGKVRAYAVTAKSRVPSAPDVPTVDEAGLPGFYMSIWHALWVPKGTPQDIVGKLNAAVRETLADPAIRKRLADMGQEIPGPDQQSPQALRALHKAEVEKWHPVIKSANIRSN